MKWKSSMAGGYKPAGGYNSIAIAKLLVLILFFMEKGMEYQLAICPMEEKSTNTIVLMGWQKG